MREYSGGYARMTVHQNLVLRWVRDEAVYDVWRRLSELGLGDAGADQVNDVVSCPGTDSCKLGITSSMGLNHAVRERIEAMDIQDPLTRKIHIKMSGCPNGCSQHHIGNIGFYGASIKVGEHTIPAYVAHIGGSYEGGPIVYGKRLKLRLPAKRVPEAVERWIRKYESERDRRRGVQRLRRARRHDGVRGRGPRPRHARGVRPGDDEPLHRLAAQGAVPGHPRRGRVRGITRGLTRRTHTTRGGRRDRGGRAVPARHAARGRRRRAGARGLAGRRAARGRRARARPAALVSLPVLGHDAVLAAVEPRGRDRARPARRSPPTTRASGRCRRRSTSTPPPHGDFRAMPALGGGFAMLKWISSFPGNPAQPRAADGDGRRLPLRRDDERAADAARRARGDRAAHRRGRGGGRAGARARGRAHRRRDRLRPARRLGRALPRRRGLRPGRLLRPAPGGGRGARRRSSAGARARGRRRSPATSSAASRPASSPSSRRPTCVPACT